MYYLHSCYFITMSFIMGNYTQFQINKTFFTSTPGASRRPPGARPPDQRPRRPSNNQFFWGGSRSRFLSALARCATRVYILLCCPISPYVHAFSILHYLHHCIHGALPASRPCRNIKSFLK
jgi:hypothetical protein